MTISLELKTLDQQLPIIPFFIQFVNPQAKLGYDMDRKSCFAKTVI